MLTTATVNYHIRSTESQAYHIDAGGVEGKILSPVQVPTKITVKDLRDGDLSVDFANDSVTFVNSPSAVGDFESDPSSWEEAYNQELTILLAAQIGAKDIIVFDHTVRIDDPSSDRKPARNVHSDYSQSGAHRRLKDIVGEESSIEWEAAHFGFVNVWRPVAHPISSAPLGFVRPNSVAPEDWVTLELIYPDRQGQIMGLAANAHHEWLYLSNMTPDEAAIFNIYDNQGLRSIGHSALDTVAEGGSQIPRMSIESRTLIRYQ